jgi:hemoglobin
MEINSLYTRLGGYDGITGFVDGLLPRLQSDPLLGRFWQNRGEDGVAREKQLLIDYLCANTGGPVYYTGRDMRLSHKGMNISESDWTTFLRHAGDTMEELGVGEREFEEVVTFVLGLKGDLVEV